MYRLALEILPTFVRARNNLGVALRRRGRVDEAIEQYELAIEHDPGNADALSNLGTAYPHLGRTEEALEAYRLRRENAAPTATPISAWGPRTFAWPAYEEAIEQFRKALSEGARAGRGPFPARRMPSDLGDEKKAAEEYKATLEIDPNYLAAQTRLEQMSRPGAAPR